MPGGKSTGKQIHTHPTQTINSGSLGGRAQAWMVGTAAFPCSSCPTFFPYGSLSAQQCTMTLTKV